ncbi:MAG: T9SS type A sorting domain-containing protein [candidate division KSB1 bacterium]|nr:T9SS type A sorting domain-containing protein [candidate division KSB1 bacterium]
MKVKLLLFGVMMVGIAAYSPLWSQGIPDPVGDVSPPSVDYVEHRYEQQGESLYVSITMDGRITDRITGYSTHTFFCDTDGDANTGQQGTRVGSENNFTFTDIGNGVWFMRMWVLWNHDPAYNSFAHRNLSPAKISEDGKTISYKCSLVGTGWEEIAYDLNGWYKDGTSWHQVPHYPGDQIEEVGLLAIDVNKVTKLVTKEGTYCKIEVPEPYSATADAKNIPGVVDEMVTLVRSEIGTISDATKKYLVSYEMFGDYAKPYPYFAGKPNQFTTRIPGKGWVDAPDWWAMLEGLINQTLLELNAGAGEILLTQHSYHRPIPGANEGWYCTKTDSSNGFLWDAFHKYTFKALLGRAYESCLAFYIAEKMTAGEAKTAIMAKKTEAETAWSNFSGTAFDLTPLIMTGFLLKQSSDLSWTKKMYTTLLPATFDLADTTNAFTKLINATVRNQAFIISSSEDFLTQAHHGWYKTIAAVQAAAIGGAMNKEIVSALQGIPDFPLDQTVYNDVRGFFGAPATSVESHQPQIVRSFQLEQNYPNPFNAITHITFTIPEEANVTVKIYNVLGKEVATLLNKAMPAGTHKVYWEASEVPSGVYFYQVDAGKYSAIKKCILLK